MKKPATIKEYLATVPAAHRGSLTALYKTIKKLYPKTTDGIGYGIPVLKLDGHILCSIRAAKAHNSLFPWSGSILGKANIKPLVKGYSQGKGSIRFAPDKPLPVKIVKAILAERVKEMKARFDKKK